MHVLKKSLKKADFIVLVRPFTVHILCKSCMGLTNIFMLADFSVGVHS